MSKKARRKLYERKAGGYTQMMHGYNYQVYFTASTAERLTVISTADEHVLTLENRKERFIKEVAALSKVFALCKSTEEAEVNGTGNSFLRGCKSKAGKVYGR